MKIPPPAKPDNNAQYPRFFYFVRWVWELLANGKFPFQGSEQAPGGGIKIEFKEGAYHFSLVGLNKPAVQLHPFQIYHQAGNASTTADSRMYRIHKGTVFLDWVETTVTGTDADAMPASITADPNVTKYWFWLAVSGSAVSIGSGADPQTWSEAKIPIGYVDTTAAGGNEVKEQFIRTDAFICS